MFRFPLERINMVPFLYRLMMLPLAVVRNVLFLAVLCQGRKIPIAFLAGLGVWLDIGGPNKQKKQFELMPTHLEVVI